MDNKEKPEHLLIRLSKEQKIKLKQLADKHNLSMGSYLKMKALSDIN
jgi:hypothetical protein